MPELPAHYHVGIIVADLDFALLRHAREFAAAGVPWIFDPGQALPMFSGEELRAVLAGCGGDPEPEAARGSLTVPAQGEIGQQPRDPCEGDDGYSDITSSTAVVLETAQGEYVDRTDLGVGSLQVTADNVRTCRFDFTVEVTEGADSGEGFTLEVGDRGQVLFTFDELLDGPQLDLE
jgi:hypothetical protein